MNPELFQIVELVTQAIVRHVEHGHGEILIQIKPGSVRVQEGPGHLFLIGKNGKGSEKPG